MLQQVLHGLKVVKRNMKLHSILYLVKCYKHKKLFQDNFVDLHIFVFYGNLHHLTIEQQLNHLVHMNYQDIWKINNYLGKKIKDKDSYV